VNPTILKILIPIKNENIMRTTAKHNESSSKAKSSTFFSPATLQPKLNIGQPNDKYEQEADAMADKVMRMPQNGIQRACADCEKEESVQPKRKNNFLNLKRMVQRMGGMEGEEEKLQTKPLMMKSEGGGGVATSALTSQLNSSKGGGSPLPASTNQFMSNAFGTDFSNVRVHTGSSAIQMNQGLNARAFTHGSDVYFNKGEYSPNSSSGKRLLGHELTHVVQQGGGFNIQRWGNGAGVSPHADYVPIPADERAKVLQARRIVSRIVNSPKTYPRCHKFFKDNCPGGTDASLKDSFDNAFMWKDTDATILGSFVAPHNIAYTDMSYRVGRWAIAASMIHEMMHHCGQASHDIGDQAKGVCGRLPNI